MERRGILSNEPNFSDRFIADYAALRQWCDAFRLQGQTIVLTMGSFDLIHIGHARYLHAARQQGDVLVVGVDSDAKIAKRKGEGRPIVPQAERLEMIAHLRSADIIALKELEHPKWHLIDTVRPDILIAVDGTYSDEVIEELRAQFGCKVVVLERQATTSTSARVREQQIHFGDVVRTAMVEQFPSFVDSVVAQAADGDKHG